MHRFLSEEPAPRPFVGVLMREVWLPTQMSRWLHVPQARGLLVQSVTGGGPAEKAGVVAGDLVVGMEGKSLMPGEDISERLAALGPNRPISIEVVRGGRLLQVTVLPEWRN